VSVTSLRNMSGERNISWKRLQYSKVSRSRVSLKVRAVGAVATMIIGFNWGGWVLGKTAENNATMLVNTALVKAYGPVCIERFKQQPNVEAKWAELTKVDTWRRESYIKESGFATPPGSTSPNAAVADACADALSKIISMQTPTAK
jgi:hypothetical protein